MDRERFKEIFLPYHQKLYWIAFRYVRNQTQAEDIVQDTYIKLWERRSRLADIDNPEAFSVVVLRNTCLDFLKSPKNRPSEEIEAGDEPSSNTSLTGQLETQEKAENIRMIINNLPEQQRELLMLRDWDGYSNKEIELLTGLSAVNVRVTLSRARKSVREEFLRRYRDENRYDKTATE